MGPHPPLVEGVGQRAAHSDLVKAAVARRRGSGRGPRQTLYQNQLLHQSVEKDVAGARPSVRKKYCGREDNQWQWAWQEE